MDLNKLKKNNLLKVGAAAILSVGVLSACGDDDPVIDENDDVEVDQPADVTPNDDVDVNEPEDGTTDDDVDVDEPADDTTNDDVDMEEPEVDIDTEPDTEEKN
ncbi:hypothetical protein CSV72_06700 [Sporosarcina sp. P20a]|uniref:hypothetical protein n=1 Tax=Sporosarcina sp. P20a TaxID=2048256 RepID=UPI000C17194F|nr:hypothetical protein [Sporosarcina sp. P20a]PIC86788.1 hypothetical protein CSV72_06700 [Sporosarcina sp. P20a]